MSSQKSLKIQYFYVIYCIFDPVLYLLHRGQKEAVRDPGRSPCAPDLHLPKPSRHDVALYHLYEFLVF